MKMCRFCAEMAVGDANWCEARLICVPDSEMSEENDCGSFAFNPIDAITGKRNYPNVVGAKRKRDREAARELSLYRRRMAGDWS